MNEAQATAFLFSQSVCAMAEIAGMQAANQHRLSLGHSIAYDEEAFYAVPDKFGIGHNTAVGLLLNG